MIGRPDTDTGIDSARPGADSARPGADTARPGPDTARPGTQGEPSTLGGWARATGWGALAVAGFGAILLLVAPGELVGVDPTPCNQAREPASCRLVEPSGTATVRPTITSTPGQVPFARSPTQ